MCACHLLRHVEEQGDRGHDEAEASLVHLADADVDLTGTAADGDGLGSVIGVGMLRQRWRGWPRLYLQVSEDLSQASDRARVVVKHVPQACVPDPGLCCPGPFLGDAIQRG
jgi:hypothetical protein